MENTKNKKKAKDNWIIKAFILTFILAIGMSIISEGLIKNVHIALAFLILIVIVSIGVIFDTIGIAVAVADEKVFVGTALETEDDYTGLNGTCALDAFTGELIWNSKYGGSSPAVSDGMVFTIADGRVYAFGDVLARDESTNEESPGFGSSVASLGLLISAIYMMRRKRRILSVDG